MVPGEYSFDGTVGNRLEDVELRDEPIVVER